MRIEKALDQLKFTISNARKAGVKDVEAYNAIVEYVDGTRKGMKRSDYLYNKIYVWAFRQHLAHYKATVFDPIPQMELHKLLEKSLHQHVYEFTDWLNEQEIYSAFNIAGSDDLMPYHVDHLRQVLIDSGVRPEIIDRKMAQIEKDREEWAGRFQEYLKKHPAIEAALYKGQKIWTFEDVAQQLGNMIAKSIEAFGHAR